jgi:hypothetical protein
MGIERPSGVGLDSSHKLFTKVFHIQENKKDDIQGKKMSR